MNSYPNVRILHGRRAKMTPSNESTVEIEVSFNGKRKWLSTGVKVLSKNWSNRNKVVGRVDALELNMKIEKMYDNIVNFIRRLMIDNRPFSWGIFEKFLEEYDNEMSFICFVKKLVETRKDIKESTRRNHRKFAVALEDFNVIRDFCDLKKSNIQKYDNWLRGRKNYTQTTIASYHKYMKVYINEALRMEYITVNPYQGIKINQGKPAGRKFLTPDELSAIETSVMPSASIERVRDMFVFQCHTGLAYSDMKKFDFRSVIQKSGRYVLHDVRQKTGEDFYIVLLPKAVEILEKYKYHLPVITNEQYNLRLKLVASYAGITKNLTSHMGRHTYASMCLNSGVKIEVLAQMLGHTDIKTTQIYAKMVNTTVEDAYLQLEHNEKIKIMIGYLTRCLELLSILLRSDSYIVI